MPRRSRGCTACRHRRIGCDGELPTCRQCRITNRECSGPLQGALVIDQTDRVVSKNRPMIHQPSNQSMFAHAFISEFISFITARSEQARRQSWLTELQSGSMADQGPALELSMQATALAYCGTVSGNPAAVREACNIYGRALTRHSRSITHDLTSPKAASLGTCVMLSLFEAICSTNPLAYGTHLQAARKMLALMPCVAGHKDELVIWQLGQHVQSQTLFVMLATPEQYMQHALAPACWTMAEPGLPKTSQQGVDRLMYNMFYLTDMLVRSSCTINHDLVLDPNTGPEINRLWLEFQDQATQVGELIQWPVPSGAQYKDPFIAMVVAYFGASWVLLSILEPLTSTHQLVDSCHVILDSSRFLGGKNLGCAHLRMFSPLTLVAMYGPCSEHREAADRLLGQRIQTTAFKGMGSVAVRRVQSSRIL